MGFENTPSRGYPRPAVLLSDVNLLVTANSQHTLEGLQNLPFSLPELILTTPWILCTEALATWP